MVLGALWAGLAFAIGAAALIWRAARATEQAGRNYFHSLQRVLAATARVFAAGGLLAGCCGTHKTSSPGSAWGRDIGALLGAGPGRAEPGGAPRAELRLAAGPEGINKEILPGSLAEQT